MREFSPANENGIEIEAGRTPPWFTPYNECEWNTNYQKLLLGRRGDRLYVGDTLAFTHDYIGGMIEEPLDLACLYEDIKTKGRQPINEQILMVLARNPSLITPDLWGKKVVALGTVYRRLGKSECYYLIYQGRGTPHIHQEYLYSACDNFVALVMQTREEVREAGLA